MKVRARSTKAAALATAALGAITLAAVNIRPASAYAPETRLTSGVISQWSQLRDSHPALWRANFERPLNDPDGIPGPDGTPDGQAAFQFFHGTVDRGAVYARVRNGYVSTGAVYGGILAGWEREGFERGGHGYPVGVERAAPNGVDGCVDAQRFQHFMANQTRYTACWSFRRGFSWSTYATRYSH